MPERRDKCQIIEADIDEEVEALANFFQDSRGDLLLLWLELAEEAGEPLVGAADREFRNLADMQSCRS